MTNTQSITPKQQEVLKLLYKYRFLNTLHIQALLRHKDKRRVTSWLKDLREKEYIAWQYNSNDFIAKAKPAIYYLSLNGIRYLRSLNTYPAQALRKRHKEPARTQAFIDQCLLVTDSCLALTSKNSGERQCVFILPSDYADPASEFHYLDELKPHLMFSKQQDGIVTNYLLENIPTTLPRYQLRTRLKAYVEYLADEWDDASGPVPIMLFICPSTADLLYVKRRAKKQIEECGNDETVIRVTTLEKVKTTSIASAIWEDV